MIYSGEGAKARELPILTDGSATWRVEEIADSEALLIIHDRCNREIADKAIRLALYGSRVLKHAPYHLDKGLGSGNYATVWSDDNTTAYKHFYRSNIEFAGLASFVANIGVNSGLAKIPTPQRTLYGLPISGVQMHAAVLPTDISTGKVAPVWAMEQVAGHTMPDKLFDIDIRGEQADLMRTAVRLAPINPELVNFDGYGFFPDVRGDNYIACEAAKKVRRIDVGAMCDTEIETNRDVLPNRKERRIFKLLHSLTSVNEVIFVGLVKHILSS